MIYEVRDLKYAYKKGCPVLNGIGLSIREGQILTVLGKNGAGKSTLFSCLLGLRDSYEGSILLHGKEVKTLKEKEIASHVGYVPQAGVQNFDFTVFEYVLMGCSAGLGLFSRPGKKEEQAAEKALDLLGIRELSGRSIRELSGGERQQAAIARAIVSEPELVIFDEPAAHLDQANQMQVLRIIKNLADRGFAAVMSTHDPNHAMLLGGDAALFDNSGCLSFGSAAEMLTEEKLAAVYGSDLKVRYLEEFDRNVCVYPEL